MLIILKNNRITKLCILKTGIILPHFPQAFTEQQPSVRRFGFLVVGSQLSVVGSFTQLHFTEQLPSVLFNQCGCNFAEWFFVDGSYTTSLVTASGGTERGSLYRKVQK